MKPVYFLSFFLFTTNLFSLPKVISFNKGIKTCIKEKKPMVVFISSSHCGWCKKMKKETFSNKKVIRVMKHFVFVIVNVDNPFQAFDYDGRRFSLPEFMDFLGIRGTPTTVFFDRKGKLITLLPGFVPPDLFIKVLNYIELDCYKKNISFRDFSLSPKKCVAK